MKLVDKLKSRKLWMTIATVLFALCGWIIGKIDPITAIKTILTACGIYVGAEALVDIARSKK